MAAQDARNDVNRVRFKRCRRQQEQEEQEEGAWPGPAHVSANGAGAPAPLNPFTGAGLQALIHAAIADCTSDPALPVGSRVWAKMRGFCYWPGVVWSCEYAAKGDVPDLLRGYKPGCRLIHWYGEHTLCWVHPSAIERCAPLHSSLAACFGSPPAAGLAHKPEARQATDGADASTGTPTAPPAVSSPPVATEPVSKSDTCDLRAQHQMRLNALHDWGRKMDRAKLVATTLWELEGSLEEGPGEVCRALRLGEAWGTGRPATALAPRVCGCCGDDRAEVECAACGRAAHALCLDPPSLTRDAMPPDTPWTCPKCGASNALAEPPPVTVQPKKRGRKKQGERAGADGGGSGGAGHHSAAGAADASTADRERQALGLTPDWIIHTVCYHVFGLQRPCPGTPYIPGLLDPATNSKLAPNIPAEKLYDTGDNGLAVSNPWAGYYVLLNPDYRSQTQWRFVNRAIDEVEDGNVPAILLLCRNSTDSAYFQRLRPYPRVLLRRNAAHFKDYERTTPGFGIAAILLATPDKTDLYLRFLSGFSHAGEASLPIDATFMRSPAFLELCGRLRLQSQHFQRDHWVQCSNPKCCKWRIIPYHAVLDLKESVQWTCAMLRPPHSNCRTALTRAEALGIHHRGTGDSEDLGLPVWQPGAAGPPAGSPGAAGPPQPCKEAGAPCKAEEGGGGSGVQVVLGSAAPLVDATRSASGLLGTTPAAGDGTLPITSRPQRSRTLPGWLRADIEPRTPIVARRCPPAIPPSLLPRPGATVSSAGDTPSPPSPLAADDAAGTPAVARGACDGTADVAATAAVVEVADAPDAADIEAPIGDASSADVVNESLMGAVTEIETVLSIEPLEGATELDWTPELSTDATETAPQHAAVVANGGAQRPAQRVVVRKVRAVRCSMGGVQQQRRPLGGAPAPAATRTRVVQPPRKWAPEAGGQGRVSRPAARRSGASTPAALHAEPASEPTIAQLSLLLRKTNRSAGQATVEIVPRAVQRGWTAAGLLLAHRPGQAPAAIKPLVPLPQVPDADPPKPTGPKPLTGAAAARLGIRVQKPWGNPSVPLIGRKARGSASVTEVLAKRSAENRAAANTSLTSPTATTTTSTDPRTEPASPQVQDALKECTLLMGKLNKWLQEPGFASAASRCTGHAATSIAVETAQADTSAFPPCTLLVSAMQQLQAELSRLAQMLEHVPLSHA